MEMLWSLCQMLLWHLISVKRYIDHYMIQWWLDQPFNNIGHCLLSRVNKKITYSGPNAIYNFSKHRLKKRPNAKFSICHYIKHPIRDAVTPSTFVAKGILLIQYGGSPGFSHTWRERRDLRLGKGPLFPQ